MPTEQIKMSYIPAQFRARCEISKQDVLQFRDPPPSLIERARTRLELEKKQKKIDFYFIYEDKLAQIWENIFLLSGDDAQVALTLAVGAPKLRGLVLHKPKNQSSHLCEMTFEGDAALFRSWSLPILKLNIRYLLSQMKESRKANSAQIHLAWLRACSGEKIVNFLLEESKPVLSGQQYHVRTHELHQYVELTVQSARIFEQEASKQELMHSLKQQAAQVVDKLKTPYVILFPDIVRTLRSALRGPEQLGIDIPKVLLASLPMKNLPESLFRVKDEGEEQEQHLPIVLYRQKAAPPGANLLDIRVSENRLEVILHAVKPEFYDTAKFSVLAVKNMLRYLGIVFELSLNAEFVLFEKIQGKEPIKDLRLVAGRPPKAGKNPHLFPIYSYWVDPEDGTRHPREVRYVRKGDLVAIAEYSEPGLDGMDVYGQKIPSPPLPTKEFSVTKGDGIEERKKNYFYATQDGLPIVEESLVRVDSGLTIKGNLPASSHTFYYNGDVTVQGSVESGCMVHIGGNLQVNGRMSGCGGYVKGNLIVEGGLTSLQKVFRVDGSVTAHFIEYSTLAVQGDLTISSHILNSEVYCGKKINLLQPDSSVLGGKIYAWEGLETKFIGRQDGSNTLVCVGEDITARRRYPTIKSLHERITAEKHRCELDLLEIRDRTALGVNVQRKLKVLRLRHPKLERLFRKTQRLLDLANERLQRFNLDAYIQVQNTLSSNATLQVCGQPVKLTHDVDGARVTYAKGRAKLLPL